MNFRFSGQKVNMKEAKYLWMIMDEHLTFKNHMDTVKLKLNSKWVISKVKALCKSDMRTIYHAIFNPTCDMGVNNGGSRKTSLTKYRKKSKTKP